MDGDTIILTDGGIPVAKLSPVTNLKRRGMLSDFEFNAEASDALDNGIAKLFEGGGVGLLRSARKPNNRL